MSFINRPPKWVNEGVEPPQEQIEKGFSAGYKPPAAYFNWFWHTTANCIEELQDRAGSTAVEAVIEASGWADGSYTFSDDSIKRTDQAIELVPASAITVEQLEQLQRANIVGVSQDVGSVTFAAFGAVPSVDVPVVFVVRGDL